MNWLRRIFSGLRRRDDALVEEIDAHRALIEDELRRAGLSSVEAAAEGRRRLGNVTLAREDARDVWAIRWLDSARRHLRHGLRGLRREPLFALTAILMLGLGTAVTTTVFSVVDAEVWRPLPYPDPHRLVEVYSRGLAPRTDIDGITLDELADWRRAPGLERLAARGSYRRRTLQLDRAESVATDEVTANYFLTLGRTARLGRVLNDDDARGSSAALLTERGWTRIFDANPDAVGRTVMLDGEAKTIVGVVTDDDALGPGPEMYVPIDEGRSTVTVFGAIGRLTPIASAEAVRDQIQAAITRRAVTDAGRRGHTAFVEDLSAFNAPANYRQLYFFLGASLLVLLLTITNTAGLLVSRALRRAPEFALRGALGGGTPAIVAQLIAEAALIVLPGCALGLWLATEAVAIVGRVVPSDFLLRGTRIAVDLRVFAFCGAVALTTLAGLAVVPLRLARRAGASTIGPGTRTGALPSAGRIRAVLLVAQIALTVILLTGAGIFLKTFVGLLHVPLGFDPASGWSARVTLGGPRYVDDAQRRTYAMALVERARAIPGVRDAAIATSSPLASGWLAMVSDARRAASTTDADAGVRSIYRAVSADYFRTIGTPLVRGRAIAATDIAGAPDVAVINEELARRLFPNADPIGHSIDLAGSHGVAIRNGRVTIVGVASDIKEVGLNEVAFADLYVSYAQRPAASIELLVRGHGEDASMAAALRSAAAAVDSTMPVTGVAPLAQRVASATQSERFNLILVAGFAIMALLIAAIGIYGALAYAATARWREFGVRLALGATPRALLRHVLWQAARLGLVGGIVGVGGALLVAVSLGDALYLVRGQHMGMLFGVTTTDPWSLTGAVIGVVTIALIAGAVPAWRVARIDPARVLRSE
jgi:predicted permease